MSGESEAATLIRGASILTADGALTAGALRIEAGRIVEIGPRLHGKGAHVFEAPGCVLAPGFVDLHLHGAAGEMFESGTEGAVAAIVRSLPRSGTTGVLATLATLPAERLAGAVRAIVAGAERADGARILGIHLEGPFLNPDLCGAQAAEWMRPPDLDELDRLQDLARGMIRLVTVAAELPGALRFIEGARRRGVVVALGHSRANEAEVEAGFRAGARHVTHLYNAMEPFHHRAAGLVGSALLNDDVSVEMICDGQHLGRKAVELALRCKPRHRVVLVSDGVAASAMREGEIELFGVPCVVRDGAVRRRAGGQLAGSCLGLDRALANLRSWFPDLPLQELLHMLSLFPAQVIGMEAECGVVAVGRAADLVLLDLGLSVLAVWRNGRMVWRTSGDDTLAGAGGQNSA